MKLLKPILIATLLISIVLGCGDKSPERVTEQKQQVEKAAEPKHNPYAVYVEKVRSGEMTAEEAEVAFADETGRPAGKLAFQLWKQGLLK